MSRSLNKVMLIGNVGSDPDVRATSSGGQVAKVSLATSRQWKDGSGQQKEKTEWHRLTFFGRLVDVVDQWVKKGDRLYVEGACRVFRNRKGRSEEILDRHRGERDGHARIQSRWWRWWRR